MTWAAVNTVASCRTVRPKFIFLDVSPISHHAEEARTRGFASPALAGCAFFVGGWTGRRYDLVHKPLLPVFNTANNVASRAQVRREPLFRGAWPEVSRCHFLLCSMGRRRSRCANAFTLVGVWPMREEGG